MAKLSPRRLLCLAGFLSVFVSSALCTDELAPAETQLAHKIAAITGPGTLALTLENRSSLTAQQADLIHRDLIANLESLGVHSTSADQAAASVSVTLSDSPQSYVWTALIFVGSKSSSALVSVPRPETRRESSDSFPVSLRKQFLIDQNDRILDVTVLQDKPSAMEIAILDSEALTFYLQRGAQWGIEQRLPVSHNRPWPRDLRGRLLMQPDHSLVAYLPGVRCATRKQNGLNLDCLNSDDPWPIGDPSGNARESAFYTAKRNYFTGDVTPPIGKFSTVVRFYSAAAFPRPGYVLWLFSGADGVVHRVDGMSDQPLRMGWGSDIAIVRSGCGSGYTLLTTATSETPDSVRAYDLPDRDPVPVSAPAEFSGPVTTLWPSLDAGSAIVISTNRETGKYEAYRLQVACNQ